MAEDKRTPAAMWTAPKYKPRLPTEDELADLRGFVVDSAQGDYEMWMVDNMLENSPIAVFDDFMTDGPGYRGKVLIVVWPSAETMTFGWEMQKHGPAFMKLGED